jgi:ABC-type branched-subunit amino acid transport system substrate-binding protein
MKIIISGSREYYNQDTVWKTLESLKPNSIVILDRYVGPESLARNWAYTSNQNGSPVNVKIYTLEQQDQPEKAIRAMLNSEADSNAIILFGHDHQAILIIDIAHKLEYTVLTVED